MNKWDKLREHLELDIKTMQDLADRSFSSTCQEMWKSRLYQLRSTLNIMRYYDGEHMDYFDEERLKEV